MLRVANAPCSWGVLEFESTAAAPSPTQVLDEIAATGYAGTELGDWGFFGTDPARIRSDLARRQLALVGAFVAVPLTGAAARDNAAGVDTAVRTARLLAAASDARPLLVLSDATAADPVRTARAGRIAVNDRLPPDDWDAIGRRAERIARAVADAAGLRTVFHHHCATYVETPDEIAALMLRTSPELVGLCLDTGHATYGGGDPLSLLTEYRDRIWHVHFKDCSREVAARARAEQWDYLTAIRHGLFCELGRGSVDFRSLLDQLNASHYDGWIVVEQDVLPSMGTPAASATRNRRFLRGLGA
jgi:inosose dehydratase